jgi:Iap family predicted aminopeptidase
MSARVHPDLVAAVRALDVDEAYLRRCVETLCGIGSSRHGFRTTGTPEDRAVAEVVASEMRAAGLVDVAIETVEVDGWRFRSAQVRVDVGAAADGTPTFDAVSWGGVPGTGPAGVSGPLVDLGGATRRDLDRLDLVGAVGLMDWSSLVSPSTVVLELRRRGLVALVVNCPPGGDWYQTPDALGGFDSHWPSGAPPMVLTTKEDAARLRSLAAAGRISVTVTLDATLTPGARGHNVVGYLPGDEAGPVVVGAHHDAWFRGSFDNTSGVAALLGLARALTGSGYRPRHTICFTTRTAEEYGIAGSDFDWCIGAWAQVQDTHPAWAQDAPFHLCLEASGHRSLRAVIETPVELLTWARAVGRAAEAEGWTPTGWRVAPPVSGTEQWPYLVSGVPGVASYSWEKSFGQTDYHTQFDTLDLLDLGHLAAQTRLHALLLLEADHDPDAILDHRARARQLSRIAAQHDHAGLASAAQAHAQAVGRAAFTPVGQAMFALDDSGAFRYPHEQSQHDLRTLDAAIEALDAGRAGLARRRLLRVGRNDASAYLSEPAFGEHLARYAPDALERTWALASHLTPSPDLWAVIASLAGEPDARAVGPWLRADLVSARDAVAAELSHRLDALSDALPIPLSIPFSTTQQTTRADASSSPSRPREAS